MFYLAHFCNRISDLDNCRVRVTARQDDVHHPGLLLKTLHHPGRIEHAVTDGVVNLVEHHEIPFARLNRLFGFSPSFFDHPDIFRIGLLGSDLHEAAAHLLHHKLVTESLHRIKFAVVPGAFQELQHQHSQSLPDSTQRGAHGGGGLALARPRVDDDETSTDVRHAFLEV